MTSRASAAAVAPTASLTPISWRRLATLWLSTP